MRGQIDLEFLLTFVATMAFIMLLLTHMLALADNAKNYRDTLAEITKNEELVRLADSFSTSGNFKKMDIGVIGKGKRIENGTLLSEYELDTERLLTGKSIYYMGGFDGEPV